MGLNIVGFGRNHYQHASRREGDFLITGFSPLARAFSIYIMPRYRDMSVQLACQGKHRIGKSCPYINKLADVDLKVLEEIVLNGVNYIHARYETWDV